MAPPDVGRSYTHVTLNTMPRWRFQCPRRLQDAVRELSAQRTTLASPERLALHERVERSAQIRVTQSPCDTLEHVVHHARAELACIRVLPAGVITADERLTVRQLVRDAMAERGLRRDVDAAALPQLHIGVEADLSKPD